jgi:peptidoglycan/LPS O-acetylase OafA/YrhL
MDFGVTNSNAADLFVPRHELEAVVALGLIVPAVFGVDSGGPIRRFLAWRPLLYIGVVSYGVYLWHTTMLTKIGNPISNWLSMTLHLGVTGRFAVLVVLVAAITTAVASVSYYVLERPLLSLKRWIPVETQYARGALAEPTSTAPAVERQRARS